MLHTGNETKKTLKYKRIKSLSVFSMALLENEPPVHNLAFIYYETKDENIYTKKTSA